MRRCPAFQHPKCVIGFVLFVGGMEFFCQGSPLVLVPVGKECVALRLRVDDRLINAINARKGEAENFGAADHKRLGVVRREIQGFVQARSGQCFAGFVVAAA